VMVAPGSGRVALVTGPLGRGTAPPASPGTSQARRAARTWLRASPAAAGLAVSRTRQTCSSVGRVGAIAFIGILIGRGAGRCAEIPGTSCKKIVLQLALQDIGQLTDFGSTGLRTSATRFPVLTDRSEGPDSAHRSGRTGHSAQVRGGPVSRG